MFEVFGEFNSADEINKKAAELISDEESLKKFALENGFEVEDAEDFIVGADNFCTPLMAALAKLDMECKEIGLKSTVSSVFNDWVNILKDMCADPRYEGFAEGVRKKGKRLSLLLAEIVSYSFEHRYQVPDEIVKNVKIRKQPSKDAKKEAFKGPLYIGIPDRARIREIAVKYYLGGITDVCV